MSLFLTPLRLHKKMSEFLQGLGILSDLLLSLHISASFQFSKITFRKSHRLFFKNVKSPNETLK